MSASLLGQTVAVIGGSAGIGLETARRARAEGADVILAARNPVRLQRAAEELGALGTAAFDAADAAALTRFLQELAKPIDHVMVTAGGPYYARLADMDFEQARRFLDEHLWLPFHVARAATGKVRPGGSLQFVGAAGFVDTPLSAALLGDQLEERREQLRATLPIGRVVEPADVAALAVHLMANTAVTGATYDVDGGQQLI